MDKEKVLNLAKLARIEIGNDEVESLAGEFEAILNYVGEVKGEVKLPEQKIQAEQLRNVLRDDRNPHASGLYTEKILEQAPAREADYIKVKKIL